MKRFALLLASMTLIAGGMDMLIQQIDAQAMTSDSNSCIDCHTDLRKLINLIWKIEASRPKPLKSLEISGEG